jgi:hypothetical protein
VNNGTHNKGNNKMATKTPRIVDAENLARIAASYRARMPHEMDIDGAFVDGIDAAVETAIMQRFDADLEGRTVKVQPGRAYASPMDCLMALLTDAATGEPGTFAKRYAVSAATDAANAATDDAWETDPSSATIAAILAYDLTDTDTDTEACATCDRLAKYGTKCRDHARA